MDPSNRKTSEIRFMAMNDGRISSGKFVGYFVIAILLLLILIAGGG